MSYLANSQTIEMASFSVEGNVIDHSWYHIVKKKSIKNCRTDTNALLILSDIVYWHKPSHKIDEETGVHSIHKKFKSDLLQKSYSELENQFGFTKEQSRSAIETLEELGIIEREFRTVNVNGTPVANIMFFKFFHDRLKALMNLYYRDPEEFKKSLPMWEKTDDPIGKNPQPCRKKPTYTEITTENTTDPECYESRGDFVEILDFDYRKRTLLKSDIYFMSQKNSCDWTKEEVDFIWQKLKTNIRPISDIFKYMLKIIESERIKKIKSKNKTVKNKPKQTFSKEEDYEKEGAKMQEEKTNKAMESMKNLKSFGDLKK